MSTKRLVNTALAAFDRAPDPMAFKIHDVVRDKLAAMGRGLRRPTGDPLSAALPPPRADAGANPAPPGVEPGHDAERARAADREQRRADREAYDAALAKHGLTNPAHGCPGSNPGGLGY